jgi:hypothetical protein
MFPLPPEEWFDILGRGGIGLIAGALLGLASLFVRPPRAGPAAHRWAADPVVAPDPPPG